MTATVNIGGVPVPPPAARATSAVRPNRAVGQLRQIMLALVSAVVAFGVLAGLVAYQATTGAYNEYHTIVDQGSVSVDAALQARALALDHMSAAATYLETSGANQEAAAADARNSWNSYSEEARVSWRNVSDGQHGENAVFTAADVAASDYIQQIGAMYSYAQSGETAKAGDSFLAARETMNTRLVPALTGLESVKVELMEATYAGADGRIRAWAGVVLGAALLLVLILLAMLLAVRRMHYSWSWPIGAALIVVILVTAGLYLHLTSAANDARVLVRDSYDNVAGVQDTAALLSQQRALDSIIVFDPEGVAGHLADFDQYNTLIEQRLCGPRDCTKNVFLSGSDTIDPAVAKAATDEQGKLGLARAPLVASVHFPGQAERYEALRVAYRDWIATHERLVAAAQSGDRSGAAAISSGDSTTNFAKLTTAANDASAVARNQFNNIWQGVYNLTPLWQLLALAFPFAAALAAWGLWQRRNELLA